VNDANFSPPARYTSEVGCDDLPLQVAVSYHPVVYFRASVVDNLFSEGPCETGHVSWNPNLWCQSPSSHYPICPCRFLSASAGIPRSADTCICLSFILHTTHTVRLTVSIVARDAKRWHHWSCTSTERGRPISRNTFQNVSCGRSQTDC
jgi:hypothetical protein